MVAQGRVGQDWAALGGSAKFPNGGAKSALLRPRATHKSQPRIVILNKRVLKTNKSQIKQRLRRGLSASTASRGAK